MLVCTGLAVHWAFYSISLISYAQVCARQNALHDPHVLGYLDWWESRMRIYKQFQWAVSVTRERKDHYTNATPRKISSTYTSSAYSAALSLALNVSSNWYAWVLSASDDVRPYCASIAHRALLPVVILVHQTAGYSLPRTQRFQYYSISLYKRTPTIPEHTHTPHRSILSLVSYVLPVHTLIHFLFSLCDQPNGHNSADWRLDRRMWRDDRTTVICENIRRREQRLISL